MSGARISSATPARIIGRRRRWWLIATIGLVSSSCSPAPPVVTAPTSPTNYIILPSMPEDDRVCVVIPNEPPYDPALVGVHCMTVHDLRLWFGRQQRAEH